jgi:GEVED domain/Bacterial Ig domain/Secretion system C-terminal sorting domain
MKNINRLFKPVILLLTLLSTHNTISAQSWLELRERGANFYDIKAAFYQEYGSKLKKMNRELRNEVSKSGHSKNDKFERQTEGMLQYMRWADFVEPRVKASNGDISVMNQNMAQALADQSRRASTRTGANWSLMGPKATPTGGGNGRINAVRAHPSVSGTLFACAPAAGLFKSTDNGASWTAISDAIAVLGATDVAFDPINPSIMYLATGDGEAQDTYSTGIYKSMDGGATWAVTGSTETSSYRTTFSKLVVNPTDGSILAGGNLGIYRSINGGTSWTRVYTGSIRDLEFKPSNPLIVYASSYGSSQFLRSTDGGVTWASTGTGLPQSYTVQRLAIAVTPLDTNYVYVLAACTGGLGFGGCSYGFGGLYLSTDGGTTFSLQSSSPNILGWEANGSGSSGQGWYDLSIAVDPSVKSTIYVGGVNIWKSTTSGETWRCVGHWSGSGAPYVHADNHDLTFIGSTLYVGNDGGVFSSSDGGSTWTNKSNNLAIAQIYGMGLSATNPNLIISGHQDNGTNLTRNGTTWSEVNGGDGMLCFIDRTNDNRMFASVYNGHLYRSTDGGANFSPLYDVPNGAWVTPWLQDPVNPTTLYAGGTEVWRSVNSGRSWTPLYGFTASTYDPIIALDVAKSNNQNIVAATRSNIMSSNDGGASWKNLTSSFELPTYSYSVLNVYFDPTNADKIYVGLASYSRYSAYCSVNGGTTWTNISDGLPNVPVNCFALQPSTGDVYCGTDIGVYLRTAGASTWTPFTSGMPGIRVKDLKIYEPTGKLRAATYARGIWESSINTVPPSVSITSPVNNTIFGTGSTVTINAMATHTTGSITKVEFYQGTTLLATSTVAPYTYTWTNPSVGNYVLTAKAYDNLNIVATSTAVNISIGLPNDAGISAIIKPIGTVGLDMTPSVILKNYGINTLTATTISYKIDNGTFADYAWTGSLASGETATVLLPILTGYSVGNHTFTAQTGGVNGGSDGNLANNVFVTNFIYNTTPACANGVVSPYNQNFNASTSPPIGWGWTPSYVYWNIDSSYANGTGNGLATSINAYAQTQSFTMIPVGPLRADDVLTFDYRVMNRIEFNTYLTAATAGWGEIKVFVSTDCGINFTLIHTINDANHIVTKDWATKNIPLSNYAGQTVTVRILVNWAAGSWSPYMDNFNIAPSCSGTPTANTATISVSTACLGAPIILSATSGSTPYGMTYQWQKSMDNGVNWTNISNATNLSTATIVTGSAQYKLVATCMSGQARVASNVVSLTAITPVYASLPYSQNFESWTTSACVTNGATHDIPSVNWLNNPTTGDNSWRRNDQGVTTGSWQNLNTAYSPTAQSGTYSARFNTYNRVAGLLQKGQLDLFIDLSGATTKTLSFYYIHTYGTDSLRVLLSTDGGQSFTQVGATLKKTTAWELKSFTLPTATATSIIRLEAGGDQGYADIGVDNLKVETVTAAPTCASLVSLTNKALCPNEILLEWAAVIDASSYDVYTNLPNVTSPINVVGTSYSIENPYNTTSTWQVVPKNSFGSPTGCPTWTFSGACYCAPTYTSGCSNGIDVITRVKLGTLDNYTSKDCGTDNYNYYHTATVPNLIQSSTQSLTLTFGDDGTQFGGAWIDYNQNGIFESTEYLGGNAVTAGNNGTYTINFTIPANALTGQTRLRVRGGEDIPLIADNGCGASTNSYGQAEDYRVNVLQSTACSGAPLANTTVADKTAVCVGEVVNLSLQNAYALTGISYQWQSSPDGLSWAAILGETNKTASQTVLSAIRYRCAITCSAGTNTYSTPVQITQKTGTQCYCTPSAACSGIYISAVAIANTTLNNASNYCSNLSAFPSSYSLYNSTAVLAQGTTYTLSVTTNSQQIVSVWIDFNQNGIFEATEWTQVSTATTPNTATTAVITVPMTALLGSTLMRVRSRSLANSNGAADACTSFGSGETEDYRVNIIVTIPVEMASIRAYSQDKSNVVEWITVSEKSLKAFVVEKSYNGSQWATLTSVEPKGGLKETIYSVNDEKPFSVTYYRVRTLELNGELALSKVVTVKQSDNKQLTILSVFPVPTTEGVNIDFFVHKKGAIILTLTNIMGQIVRKEMMDAVGGINKTFLNFNDLSNGTYFLSISDNETAELRRVVRQ